MGESRDVARILVKCGAVQFRTNPWFTFTSGTKSPVYVDNRALLSYVSEREHVVDQMVKQAEDLAHGEIHGVAGTATAGIPWAAWLSSRLKLPMLYVRSGSKRWGLGRSVEGQRAGIDRVLVVEDLVFSGGSTLDAVRNLRKAGITVMNATCIVTYSLDAVSEAFEREGVTLDPLTRIEDVIGVAEEYRVISACDGQIIRGWLDEARRQR